MLLRRRPERTDPHVVRQEHCLLLGSLNTCVEGREVMAMRTRRSFDEDLDHVLRNLRRSLPPRGKRPCRVRGSTALRLHDGRAGGRDRHA